MNWNWIRKYQLFSLFFGLEEGKPPFGIFLALVRNQQQVCSGERSEAGMATARKQHDGSMACGQTGLSLAAALATTMDRLAASRKLTLPCVGEILTQVRVRSNGRQGRR